MTFQELLPTLRDLDRPDKLRVIQFLAHELARDEGALLQVGTEYPIWSPHGAFDAAAALLEALQAPESPTDAKR